MQYLVIGVVAMTLSIIGWIWEYIQARKQGAKLIRPNGRILIGFIIGALALLKGSGLISMDWFG